MILLFPNKVNAIRYTRTTITGGTSLGNGTQIITVPAQGTPNDYIRVNLPPALNNGDEIDLEIPVAITFGSNVGNIPSWYAYGIHEGNITTCTMTPIYTNNSNIAGAYISSNISCKFTYIKPNTNSTIDLTIYNPFANSTMAVRFNTNTTLILPNYDNNAGGTSGVDYTQYLDDIENLLNTIDTNGDNRYNGIMTYLRQMNTDRANEYNQYIIKLNAILQALQNGNNNWQQFMQTDISQQDQTPPDTTTIDTVQEEESQQISDIQTAIQNIQAPTFDLTDFTLTFAWIWQTIIYLFTTHTILMSTMTIVLSLGFVKTIFGR